MEKKIIFFDVDGTLVLPHQKPRPKVKEAIQALRANGHLAFICTGRNRCMLEKEVEDIGFDGIICSAGSFIEIDNKVIEKSFMDHKKVLEIMNIFDQSNVAYILEGTYNSFADEKMVGLFANSTDQPFDNSELERIHKEIEKGMNRKSIEEFHKNPMPIHKISFIAEKYEDLNHPKELLESEYNFVVHDIFSKNSVNGEIIDRFITKGTAINKVLEFLQLPQQQTIGFGDSMNDYEMLQTVAYGVAMEDGAKDLKAIADAICPGVKDDGVYQELKKLKLI
jgi:Cof subfamily protein (haloacid dehalogenase superfamily)